MSRGWIIGLDIGGTFTDVVTVHAQTGRFGRFKCLSTPDDPARGALAGVEGVLREVGARPDEVSVVLHATTLVSNALIERKGARTTLITTRGFRDLLTIAREKKFDIYDLQIEKPVPLVTDALRFEADERLAADGEVVQALSDASVAELVAAVRASGAEAVAVCLLHAYVDPVHERRIRAAFERTPQAPAVSLSSDVLPEMREYERASTTAANAFVQPVADRYLEGFSEGLRRAGLEATLFIMLSEGGLAAPEVVRRFPVRICESGPAAGAVTSASIAQQGAMPRVLSFDMGGTTAKTCLIHDGAPEITTDFEVARTYRFKKGSGLPLRVPVVDLIEIGAGGGSIVRVDGLGLIKVGPDSIGADPGPACYGRGGTLPTVTDADLVLGYLGAGSFLGGRMELDVEAARRAIAEHVAEPLGISLERAAQGIHAIVNENMANASRVQAVERGHEPAAYTMVAFGGAGPVHAWDIARRLRISSLVIPPSAGLGSALGLTLAPRAYRSSRTRIGNLDALDWSEIEGLFEDMRCDACAALGQAGVTDREMRLLHQADLRYRGQRKELTVELPGGQFALGSAREIRGRFEALYRRVYHRIHADHAIETLSWRLTASGPPISTLDQASFRGARASATPATVRPMMFGGWSDYRDSAVYRRDALVPGAPVQGPCVVEEPESTTVVGPGAGAQLDAHGNLVLSLAEPQA